MNETFQTGSRQMEIAVQATPEGWQVGDRRFRVRIDREAIVLEEKERERSAEAVFDGKWWWVWLDGIHYKLRRVPRTHAGSDRAHRSEGLVQSPMTGKVVALLVKTGDEVPVGGELLRMEAMKMLYTLSAPVAGTVGKVACEVGAVVDADQILVEIVPVEENGQ